MDARNLVWVYVVSESLGIGCMAMFANFPSTIMEAAFGRLHNSGAGAFGAPPRWMGGLRTKPCLAPVQTISIPVYVRFSNFGKSDHIRIWVWKLVFFFYITNLLVLFLSRNGSRTNFTTHAHSIHISALAEGGRFPPASNFITIF